MGKITMYGINFPTEESVEKFKMIGMVENLKEKITRPQLFEKIVNYYYDRHTGPILEGMRKDSLSVDGEF